jgi:iron complex outermembrane receptor protein
MRRQQVAMALAALTGAAADAAHVQAPAQVQDAGADTPVVLVSTSRFARPGVDQPAAIGVVTAAQIGAAQPRVNASEALVAVPGIVVQNRQNYAQDLQISSRGFGARSAFGVRGVRLVADGIPATMPDGQGQAARSTSTWPNASKSCAVRFRSCTATTRVA